MLERLSDTRAPYLRGASREYRGYEVAPLLAYAVETTPAERPEDKGAAPQRDLLARLSKSLVIALEFAGPKTIVDSLRRDLRRGDRLTVVHPGRLSHEFRLPRPASYPMFLRALPNGYTHALLLHPRATLGGMLPGHPGYLVDPASRNASPGSRPSNDRMLTHFHHALNLMLPLPLFLHWTPYLWEAGVGQGLVRPLEPAFGVTAWGIQPDAEAWHAIVRLGLRDGVLRPGDAEAVTS
jgi:hypothetical protein